MMSSHAILLKLVYPYLYVYHTLITYLIVTIINTDYY